MQSCEENPHAALAMLMVKVGCLQWPVSRSDSTESQHGRGWKGPLGIPQSNLLPKQGHPQQAAQHRIQAGLEYLQRRRLHSLPGQPGPGLRHPQREEVLPHVQTELPVLQFVPIAPCPVAGHHWKESGPILLTPTMSAEFDRKIDISKKTEFPQSLWKQTATLRWGIFSNILQTGWVSYLYLYTKSCCLTVVEWENTKRAESLHATQPQEKLWFELSPQ